MRAIIILTTILVLTPLGYPNTWYVPDDYTTIQEGIDAAANGDTVVVRPGTYVKAINFWGKAITLRSENGAAHTIIDGTDLYVTGIVCVNGEGPDTVLDGFTVKNFETSLGAGGMRIMYASPTVTNCVFTNNDAGMGAGGGIGVYSGGSPMISNCVFLENCALSGGGLYWGDKTGTPLTNNVFINNTANQGGGAYFHRFIGSVDNCTFVENTGFAQGGALVLDSDANVTVVNSVLWNDTPDEIFLHPYYPSITVSHSDVQGGYQGTGNIDTDPMFVDIANNDFHLTWLSPCIDAGDNYAPSLPATDFEGDPRIFPGNGIGYLVGAPPQPAIVDMGADEYCLLKRLGVK